MKDLKEIKQAVVPYGTHSPFVRERVKIRTSSNKVTPHKGLQLVLAALEDRPQLQCKCYWREETKILEE